MPYADPQKKRESDRAYGRAHSEATRARVKAWNAAHPEKAREHQRRHYLRAKYGLTLAQFDELLAKQSGRCAICRSASPGLWTDFVVDHDHTTGTVRGLVCTYCNTGLGQFKDRPDLMREAADYVERGGVAA